MGTKWSSDNDHSVDYRRDCAGGLIDLWFSGLSALTPIEGMEHDEHGKIRSW
jgi:hypothetical protein